MNSHEQQLDDVATYAIGALSASEAQRVRDHLATCEECRTELRALMPVASAVGISSEACTDAASGRATVSPLLKARIMRQIRTDENTTKPRAMVWPAYLVAAACFAIALLSSLANLSLMSQLKSNQNELAAAHQSTTGLTRNLADERTTLGDLMNDDAKRYDVTNGQVVTVRDRLYITLHNIASPPRGKVYQAWTLPKGSKTMEPSVTFVPDQHGVAVVSIPAEARNTAVVAVSVEPDGGSKQPTSKPTFVVSLD